MNADATVRLHLREFNEILGDPRAPEEVEGRVSRPLGIVIESLVSALPLSSTEPDGHVASTHSLGLSNAKRIEDIPVIGGKLSSVVPS